MQQAYVVTGSLTDARTVTLDEALPAEQGKVRVVLELLPAAPRPDLKAFLERMWQEQRQRGFQPPTKEEVDAYLRAERESWDRQP